VVPAVPATTSVAVAAAAAGLWSSSRAPPRTQQQRHPHGLQLSAARSAASSAVSKQTGPRPGTNS
jgi:hypothetical protein